MARGVWRRDGDELLRQRQQQRQHLVHILVGHDAEQEDELLPGKRSRRLWTVARIPWALWLPSSRKAGECRSSSNRPGQLTCSRPVRMALSGMFQPLPRSTRRAVMARAAFLG